MTRWRGRIPAWIALTLLVWPVLAQLATSDLAEASLGKRLFVLSYSASILALPLLLLPLRVSIGLLSPLAFLGWAEGWHILQNRSSITEGAWAAAIGSNPAESLEFLRTVWPWLGAGMAAFVYCIGFALRSRTPLKAPLRNWSLLAFALPLLGLALDVHRAGSAARSISERFSSALDLQAMRLDRIYPTSSFLKLHSVISERTQMREARSRLSGFRFGAGRSMTDSGEAAIVVLVVGEATRSDRLSVCGASRSTTPMLGARNDIFWFCDAIAPANLTHTALPFLLTRATPLHPETSLRERSLVAAFSEAGFRTVWISNQPIHSGGSLETQLIASDADTVIALNENIDAPSWDRVVLGPVAKALDAGSKPLFLAVHMMGCHLRYNWRYPPSREVFAPAMRGSVSGTDFDISRKTEIVNAYDNAVLEQDLVLDSLIRLVQKTNRPAIVLFVPDHGENLFDPPHGRILHGSPVPTAQEIRVPLMVWASTSTGLLDSTARSGLSSNRSRRVCAAQALPTLLDAAGISVPGSEPSASLLRSAPDDKNCPVATPTGEVRWSDDLLR